jgi:hypothetical protein
VTLRNNVVVKHLTQGKDGILSGNDATTDMTKVENNLEMQVRAGGKIIAQNGQDLSPLEMCYGR